MSESDVDGILRAAGREPLMPAEASREAGLLEQQHPWVGILAPRVLACEGGDRVVLVGAGPVHGQVIRFPMEGMPERVAVTLEAWLAGEVPDPDGERSAQEELGAQHLVANAFEEDVAALALAIPLVRANVGLLVELARHPVVGAAARARLERVADPETLSSIRQGSGPRPWEVPGDVQPRVEEELDGWLRVQNAFDDGAFGGVLRVLSADGERSLRLAGEVPLVEMVDALLEEGGDLALLDRLGCWTADEAGEAELDWRDPDAPSLSVGSLHASWTRS